MDQIVRDKNNNEVFKGDKVLIEYKKKKVLCTFSHVAPNGMAYLKDKNGKAYERRPNRMHKVGNSKSPIIELKTVNDKYSINKRFQFLESLVRMTTKNKIVSLLITGEGGIGKTYTVMKEISKTKMIEDDHYIIVKGYSTAKGLYETLYNNSNRLIVFDDCDEVLKNEIAVNILKGALDSYSERIVSWVKSQSAVLGDIPTKFEFKGRIIFISNKPKNKIPQPILSRAVSIDLSMNSNEKIQRMENILPNIRKEVPLEMRKTALNILRENQLQIQDLNFRTLLKAISALDSGEENVEELVEFMIMS